MKKTAYWFLVGFGVWCVACSVWYLFDVKGVLISDPKYFDAGNRFIAIAEILFMLLGACLFGFAIAWWLKQEEVLFLQTSVGTLLSEKENLILTSKETAVKFQTFRSRSASEISMMKLKISELTHESETLKKRWVQEEEAIQKLKIEKAERTLQLEQKNSEVEKLTTQINQFESNRRKLEQVNSGLELEIIQLRSTKEQKQKISNHPFVKPAISDRKDDLTKIKGIGPFIEKRLNMLGIYSFEQLSQLEPEMVERVGAAIEFFPGRIARENWIGQAKRFAK